MNPGGSAGLQKVGLWACAALVVANMVGTGVFTSLGFQVGSLPSTFVILCLWALGGVVAFCGALAYAELAAALPRSGGEYHFLGRIYHPCLGFAGGFVSFAVGFAAPIALAAMALGEYLSAAWPGLEARGASFGCVLGLAAAHAVAVRTSGTFQIVFTILKVGMILAFLAAGFVVGGFSGALLAPSSGDAGLVLKPSFAVALMFVLFSYSGWNAAAYVVGEVRKPQRTVPAALMLATGFVAVLYVALNALFLLSAPMEAYEGRVAVAEVAASALFGERGGQTMAVLIGLGLVASISAMTWAGPRVAQTVGQDYAALAWFAKTSSSGVPRRALGVQTALAVAYMATSTYETVLIYTQFALVLCGFLTVLGVFVLRIREPGLQRPFRCAGYPFTPLLFLAVSLFALVYTAVERPLAAAGGAATLLFGGLLYGAFRRRAASSVQIR
jgi:basic amino acid/polyamine antiporter, APA family